jgi:hypothetical protein
MAPFSAAKRQQSGSGFPHGAALTVGGVVLARLDMGPDVEDQFRGASIRPR